MFWGETGIFPQNIHHGLFNTDHVKQLTFKCLTSARWRNVFPDDLDNAVKMYLLRRLRTPGILGARHTPHSVGPLMTPYYANASGKPRGSRIAARGLQWGFQPGLCQHHQALGFSGPAARPLLHCLQQSYDETVLRLLIRL